MSTLRERAQAWLDKYKAGDFCGGNVLSLEDLAAIIAEYLQDTKADAEAEYRAREFEKQIQELNVQLDAVGKRVIRLEGENSALRFSVRCNGVSGAEV